MLIRTTVLFLFSSLLTFASLAAEDLNLGGILILSGEGAPYGINAQRGAELARQEINLSGGISGNRLNIHWEDEAGGKAANAVSAYRKLVGLEGLRFIIGTSYQDGLLALAPLAKRDEALLLTPSTPALDLPNVFSTWIDPKQEARFIADYVFRKFKTVAVLSSEQSWDAMVATEFKQRFSELGGRVVAFEEPSPDILEVGAQALRVKISKPEAVFISSYLLFTKYLPALKQLKVAVPLFGIEVDRSVIEASKGAAEGMIFVGPNIPKTDFDQRFKMVFGTHPDVPAYQAYDLVKLLAKAIAEVGTDPNKVAQWLNSFSKYEGVAGTYEHRDGRMIFSSALFRVQGLAYERQIDSIK